LLAGTHLLDVAEAKKIFIEGRRSRLHSTDRQSIVDDFNVNNNVYKQPQNVDGCIYPSLTLAQP
jgi:hypothetical protein